ncbi:uncharacterized protein LOC106168539 [Lingula anatina]|uniref:Uncharacterized protein LOC106168539 n=1 Tax=Lingula anatina TaxID=7574 RepID=A0A1S3IY20_LINAN|nr:uncharacterized protein LOC106168539 [Lingula anatina]|eukprot:XP_013403090.1 uncharacterized protein LOC106168539 [Lingula anatina]
MSEKKFVAALCIIAASLQVSHSVECYSCYYPADRNCGDPWSWANTITKPHTSVCDGWCTKVITGDTIGRGCSLVCASSTLGSKMECCSHDLCNSAGIVQTRIFLLLPVTAIVFIVLKLQL